MQITMLAWTNINTSKLIYSIDKDEHIPGYVRCPEHDKIVDTPDVTIKKIGTEYIEDIIQYSLEKVITALASDNVLDVLPRGYLATIRIKQDLLRHGRLTIKTTVKQR